MPSAKQDKSQHGSELSALQSKMARVALGWGVRELAAESGVATDTIARLERGEELRDRTLAAIRGAMEKAGIQFIEDGDVSEAAGPGVRLAKRGRKR